MRSARLRMVSNPKSATGMSPWRRLQCLSRQVGGSASRGGCADQSCIDPNPRIRHLYRDDHISGEAIDSDADAAVKVILGPGPDDRSLATG